MLDNVGLGWAELAWLGWAGLGWDGLGCVGLSCTTSLLPRKMEMSE